MTKDSYSRVASIYDKLFEPMNRGLRILGFRMFLPPRGGSILDIGCGTGIHLEMYRKYNCDLYGIDTSPSMLELAKARLGENADLRLADATNMPYEAEYFDLVICMLALHEMDESVRDAVLAQTERVLKKDGHVLLIDFHAGRPRPLKGWLSKLVILISEIAAGSRHFRNYRHFISIGGLPAIIEKSQFVIEKERIVGENTMALYLVRP
ncbi:MAG: class I SAM-dependent methyltransferase [Anaerolineales bacterium]|nr:MAG: class I SAM-dependent methyltransferase [Anaerolineales bacterium]